MWYIDQLDSSRVATLVKVRSATRVSSSDPTRVKSNYIPVYNTILRQIERCQYVMELPNVDEFYISKLAIIYQICGNYMAHMIEIHSKIARCYLCDFSF